MPARHEPADPMIGRVLADRYEIQHRLGEGAMGVVYRARHIKVGRPFAIKVLNARALRDQKLVQRFEREAAIAGRLRHPNVVGVVDVGVVDGARYLVMEFAEGPDLAELLGEAPMPPPRIIPLVRQLLDGLYHAHEHGLIHRDFKPENVIVERDAHGAEVPRIVDFGIALLLDDDEPGDGHGRLTTNGLVLGTPHYMAPEQAVADPIDHRIDLFALGIVIYELLCGRLPFDGRGADIARANLLLDPPAIRERVPHLEVDPLLEAFSRRLMAKSRDDRPATAKLARDLLDLIEADRSAAAVLLGVPLARIGRGPALTEAVALDSATALDAQATLRLKKPSGAAPGHGREAAAPISPAALLAALPGPGMTVLSTPPPAPAGAPLPGAARPAMLPPWPGAAPSPSARAMTPSATFTAVSAAGIPSPSAARTAVSPVASPRTPSTALTAVSLAGPPSAGITAVSPVGVPSPSKMVTAVSPIGVLSPSKMVTAVSTAMSLPTPSAALTAVSPMLPLPLNADQPASSDAPSSATALSPAPPPTCSPLATPPPPGHASPAPTIMYVPQRASPDANAHASARRSGRDPEASRATSLGWQTSSLPSRRRRSWLIGGLVLAACGAAAVTVVATSTGDSDLSFHGRAAEAMRAAMAGPRDPAPAAPSGDRGAAGDRASAARASAASSDPAGAAHDPVPGSGADAAHREIDTASNSAVADAARDGTAVSVAARSTGDTETAPSAVASPDRRAEGAPAGGGAAIGDGAERDEQSRAHATERTATGRTAERPRETTTERSTATERSAERRRHRSSDAGSDDARSATQSARMRSESAERAAPAPPTERGEAGAPATRPARAPAATASDSGPAPVGIAPATLRQLYEATWSAIGQLGKTDSDDLTGQMLLLKIQDAMQAPAAARARAADKLRRILQEARRRSADRREP